jgi:hypothetical protein
MSDIAQTIDGLQAASRELLATLIDVGRTRLQLAVNDQREAPRTPDVPRLRMPMCTA